ncbi:MAG: sugar ABC transporter ATP-binding protein [Sphaerochaeta sp.]|uniref:Xylose import ATP-binding protein XylG n=1 Tax=bioreactor metagenome TaxID=1076179 RepID=A0A644XPZ6_9ZZZZ|nr:MULTISPECIES: sugar ABC transporter ATP-binding protein [Sphaerochaeta]MDD4036942.1 sugar ABC transporter ATP-binding protein [Sphaerochaeta sp.]MDD4449751.1 sugar ABC transporter ATP-binding protein [Sphaerochaeta sp.]MEA5028346.1 sugar ABC transporter ATP-binding protein [Sphaerochaeta associata]MEA5108155.1 sugar ABC transporter ATP-binding protein [Sphaerochaeta associata]
METLLLEMKHITKTFPGVRALNDVNLQVRPGEIHAIVGENGAGKSTLMNILSGVYPASTFDGDILVHGKSCQFHTIKESEEQGIVIIHQELALVPYLTIAENMFLGNEQGRIFSIDWDKTYSRADELLALVGLEESSKTSIKDIGVGKQQLVEIAKALAKNVKVLILDEPTASLNDTEAKKLLDLLLQFKARGMTSILISHKLNEVSYIADRITVIRDGEVITTMDKTVESFDENKIIKAMVGRNISDRFPKRNAKIGQVSLEVEHWTAFHPLYEGKKVCEDINLKLHKGEVVGISGLMGAGRTEFAMSLFGKSYGRNITGTLRINGKEVQLNSIKNAIQNKLAYVTEDRKGNGLILSKSIMQNTTLAKLDAISKYQVIDPDLELKVSKEVNEKLHTKCSSVLEEVNNLSGGNQQKVLLSKWIFAEPDILLLDEPTRGIDVGAKYEIYCIINQLAEEGKSILFISSEMPEILGICDRIYVLSEGRIVGEMLGSEASQEKIMKCIVQNQKGDQLP